MVVVIFLTGTGATIASFCCDNCADKFFSQLYEPSPKAVEEEHSCCSKSAHQTQEHECKDLQHQDKKDCCSVQRENTTLDSFHFKPTLLVPFTWIANVYAFNAINPVQSDESDILLSRANDPPQPEAPREYLAFIRILII